VERDRRLLLRVALHWLVNGGNWEIINRSSAHRVGSHMDGESTTGPGRALAQGHFQGQPDHRVLRRTAHGFLRRPGDLNLTTMAGRTSPEAGYTVTLHRVGLQSRRRTGPPCSAKGVCWPLEKYSLPRVRKGSVPPMLNPLIAAGRPIPRRLVLPSKFRRIGTKLGVLLRR